ncbi:uncharacterized protein K460DRAFT_365398 [Cucurbitaria berberidis CBS 394.84]|uniref:Uncharacterized protein n=1 Tax=Cucurbitaria berberidis CBS 394.84 TaxID=1168544 RepID=A0A9P4LCL7_9PLEO|nr:uncharacterized protein K460DRAFT_365398 [Cucurbitaria berberidis CBS 394.84]KAF1849502.1 hypothetical protein K460DRAFT_365398 [Cucurbitaria berberidis CBS 394.84]
MSSQRTPLRSHLQNAFRPLLQRQAGPLRVTRAISTNRSIYKPSKNSYNLLQTKWDKTKVYRPHAMENGSVLAQVGQAKDIIGSNAKIDALYTPNYSGADTEKTYQAHPGGYEPVKSKIAEAKREMLDRISKCQPLKRLARKMVESLPDEPSVIEEFDEEHKEHQERIRGEQRIAYASFCMMGFSVGLLLMIW